MGTWWLLTRRYHIFDFEGGRPPQLIQSPFEDYEEGMWTPYFDGVDPTLRYCVDGRYVKVGNVVMYDYHLSLYPAWKRPWLWLKRHVWV